MKPPNQRNGIQIVLQRLSLLTAIMIHIHNVQFIDSDDQVYQPTKQEIERFQVIQEQIRHHQQEEQNEKRKNPEKITFLQEQQRRQDQETEKQLRQQENMMMMIEPRHPAESLLIPHSALVPMFVHKQQQYSDHRVPMPPQIIPPPPPTGFINPMVNHPQSRHLQHQQFVPQSPVLIPQPPSMPEVMNINYNHNNDHHNHHPFVGDRIRQINQNGNNHNVALNHLNRNSGQSIDTTVRQYSGKHQAKNSLERHHHHHPERDDGSDVEHQDSELSESSRFDKNHPGPGEEGRYGRYRFRCYSCHWDIAKCSDFNCYNNPDICTTNNFQPHLVQQADCPGGCEEFVITDPNGLTQQWKRGCAQPASLPITRMRCQTFYEFGVRIDRCVCNSDWCNGGVLSTLGGQQLVKRMMVSVAITVILIIITSIISS